MYAIFTTGREPRLRSKSSTEVFANERVVANVANAFYHGNIFEFQIKADFKAAFAVYILVNCDLMVNAQKYTASFSHECILLPSYTYITCTKIRNRPD